MRLCFSVALTVQLWAVWKVSNSAHSNFMAIWIEWSLFILYFIVKQEKGAGIRRAVTHHSTSASNALEFSHCSQYAVITIISSSTAWTYGQCLVSGRAFLPRFRCPNLLITVLNSFQYERQMRTVPDKTKPGMCWGNVGVPGCWLEL